MRRSDDRLLGAWVPDPGEVDATYAPSLVIDTDFVWYLTRQEDGLHTGPTAYRVERGDRVVLGDRVWPKDRVRYRFDSDGVLHWNDRRYLPTSDPGDRAWPPELEV